MTGRNSDSKTPPGKRYRCPTCRSLFACDGRDEQQKKRFPFCSARCKMADLDKWFTEDYSISRPAHPDDLEEEEARGEGPNE